MAAAVLYAREGAKVMAVDMNLAAAEETPVVEVTYGSPRHVLRTPNGEIHDRKMIFHTTKAQIDRTRKSHQVSFDRCFPEISHIGFEYTWGGALSLAQNGGMVFGDLADRVWGAGFCNGTGVSRGAVFGRAIAEHACGMSSRAIDILLRRNRPSRAYPRPITALGVKVSTGYRLWMAGREV